MRPRRALLERLVATVPEEVLDGAGWVETQGSASGSGRGRHWLGYPVLCLTYVTSLSLAARALLRGVK